MPIDPLEAAVGAASTARQSLAARTLSRQGPWWFERARLRAAVKALGNGSGDHIFYDPAVLDTLPEMFAELGRAGNAQGLAEAGQAWVSAYERRVAAYKEEGRSGASMGGDEPWKRYRQELLDLLDSPEGCQVWRADALVKQLDNRSALMRLGTKMSERHARNARAERRARMAGRPYGAGGLTQGGEDQ
ncbi:hypothetical protein [Micrococcus luteus]|uniref:hypothetical protein n=1 Tax=Micrococcus luteus TaxID=1270 RepID=UPI002303D192|nr:hypothetical protein [Micrococcus luteus]